MIIFTRILEKEILFSVKLRNKNFTVQNLLLYFSCSCYYRFTYFSSCLKKLSRKPNIHKFILHKPHVCKITQIQGSLSLSLSLSLYIYIYIYIFIYHLSIYLQTTTFTYMLGHMVLYKENMVKKKQNREE